MRIAWLAVILSLAAGAGCSKPEKTAADFREQAQVYLDNKDFKAATIELKNAVRAFPTEHEFRVMLGKLYLEVGGGAAAENEFEKAIDSGANRSELAVPLTRAQMLQGKYGAVAQFELGNYIGLERAELVELHTLRGDARLAMNDLDVAASEYAQALALDETDPGARLGQARLTRRQGDALASKKAVMQLLEEDPGYADAWSFMGDLHRGNRDLAAAEEAYTQAIANREDAVRDHLFRAGVRLALQKTDGFNADVEAAHKIAPNAPLTVFYRGVADYLNRDYEAASAKFDEAQPYLPQYPPLSYLAGLAHFMQGHSERALQNLSQVEDSLPNAARMLAVLYLQDGNFDKAKRASERALAANPDDRLARATLTVLENPGSRHQVMNYLVKELMTDEQASAPNRVQFGLMQLQTGQNKAAAETLAEALENDDEVSGDEALRAHVGLVMAALQQGDAMAATLAADKLLEKFPHNASALNVAGTAYSTVNKDKARAYFQRALERDRNSPAPKYNLANLALADGDTATGERLLKGILKTDPTHLKAAVKLAELEARLGKIEQSQTRLQSVIAAHPQALRPRMILAHYYSQTGRSAEGLALLEATEEQAQQNPQFLSVLGQVQMRAGRNSGAVKTLTKLAELVPQSADVQCRLAGALLNTGQADAARAALDKASSIKVDHLCATLLGAKLALQTNDVDAAKAAIDSLDEKVAENPAVAVMAADIAMQEGDFAAAEKHYQRAVAKNPNRELVSKLAQIKARRGGPQAGIAYLEEWLAKNPGDTATRLQKANLQLFGGDSTSAIKTYKEVLAAQPRNVNALNNLATALTENRPEDALRYAEQAYEAAPENPAVLDTYGLLLVKNGSAQQGTRLLQSAAEGAPHNAAIKMNLLTGLLTIGDQQAARKTLKSLEDNNNLSDTQQKELARIGKMLGSN